MDGPPETGFFAQIAEVREGRPAALPGDSVSWLVLETPSLRVALQRFADVEVLRDEARQVDVVVHGQLYDGASLQGLIDSYCEVGAAFVEACSGLFSIMLVDRRGDKVILATDRLGSITKQGSATARFILGQLVLHVLRRDPAMKAWYQRIKKRRGSKIARVAVMRRLATIIWHMVKHHEPYVIGGPPSGKLRSPAA